MKNIIETPIEYNGEQVPAKIYQDEFGVWKLWVKYPKVPRRWFYSIANEICLSWNEQYPQYVDLFNN